MKFFLAPIFLLFLCFDAKADGPPSPERPHCDQHKENDKIALACNIYWEGRNQAIRGMLGVAAVTLWRVRDPQYPNTIGEVVWQKAKSNKSGRTVAQFSWTLDGKKDRPHRNEMREWQWALLIAGMFALDAEQKDALCTQAKQDDSCDPYQESYNLMRIMDPTGGSTMFHASHVNPHWRKAFYFVVKIGDHLFYRKATQES